jgi:hypothetical protein
MQAIPLLRIVGPEPRGRCPERHKQLITAVRLHRHPCFSFDGLRLLGDQFLSSCFAPALLFAARYGNPAYATDLSPPLAADLHAVLLEMGVLLPSDNGDRILGASEPISAAHRALCAGADTAPALASALGTSTLAAAGHLRLLDHWGVSSQRDAGTSDGFPVAI